VLSLLHALALASAPDVPAADDPPKPMPPAVDEFVWLVDEPVTVPVTPNPAPAAAPETPVAEPLSVALKMPMPATPADVEPPEVLSLEDDVPVAKADTEAIASNAARRVFFMIHLRTGVIESRLDKLHANTLPNKLLVILKANLVLHTTDN
jgi:hypothetical protein